MASIAVLPSNASHSNATTLPTHEFQLKKFYTLSNGSVTIPLGKNGSRFIDIDQSGFTLVHGKTIIFLCTKVERQEC